MENVALCAFFNGGAILLNAQAAYQIIKKREIWKSRYYLILHSTNLATQSLYLASVITFCSVSPQCLGASLAVYNQGGIVFALSTIGNLINLLYIVFLNSSMLEIFVQLDPRHLSRVTASRIKFVLLPVISLGMIFPIIYTFVFIFSTGTSVVAIDALAIFSNLYVAVLTIAYDNFCSIFLARLIFNSKEKSSQIHSQYKRILFLLLFQISLDWIGIFLYGYASVFAATFPTYYGFTGIAVSAIGVHIVILRMIVIKLAVMVSTVKTSVASSFTDAGVHGNVESTDGPSKPI